MSRFYHFLNSLYLGHSKIGWSLFGELNGEGLTLDGNTVYRQVFTVNPIKLSSQYLCLIALLIGIQNPTYGQCWSEVSLGSNSTLAIGVDNKLYAAGLNASWQLGVGAGFFSVDTFVQVMPNEEWTQVSCGNFHSLAINQDGTLWAWGNNNYGQLGNGNNENQATPIQIGSDDDWEVVNTGFHFSMAMKSDGSLWSWGRNLFGQLGLGDDLDRLVPTEIPNHSWSSFTTGNVHALAIEEDGTLWVWGNNFNGQIGPTIQGQSSIPTMLGQDNDWAVVSSEGLHTMSIKADGTLWAWGNNISGQLGLNSSLTNTNVPTQVGEIGNWEYINTSEENSAGIRSDGTLWIWGDNEYGQLGPLDSLSQSFPIQLNTDMDWTSVNMGLFHVGATKNNGELYTWGRNNVGQLGSGTLINEINPKLVPCDSIITSTVDISKKAPTIYPNPTYNEFYYHSDKRQTLYLYNINGHFLKEYEVAIGLNSCDLSGLSAGCYLLMDSDGIGLKIVKVE